MLNHCNFTCLHCLDYLLLSQRLLINQQIIWIPLLIDADQTDCLNKLIDTCCGDKVVPLPKADDLLFPLRFGQHLSELNLREIPAIDESDRQQKP